MRLGPDRMRTLEAFERSMYRDFYAAAPAEVVEELGVEFGDERYGLRLTVAGENHPFFNRVMLAEDPTGAELRSLAETFRSLGVSRWMLQVPPTLDPVRRDFIEPPIVSLRGWAKHVFDPDRVPDLDDPAADQPRVRVVEVDEAVQWARIVAQCFDFPSPCVAWLAALTKRPRWSLYLAEIDGRPAATGALFVDGDNASLNWAATLPDFRRRGGQSALILRRLKDALEADASLVVSETDEPPPGKTNPSTHNLTRHGMPVVYVRPNLGPAPPP